MPDSAPPAQPTASARRETARSVAPGVADRARAEMLRMACDELKRANLLSAGITLGFGVAVGILLPSPALWIWLLLMLGLGGVRAWLGQAFDRGEPGSAPQALALRQYGFAVSLGGLGWGVSVWIFPTLDSGILLGTTHLLILAGLIAGAARALLPIPGASRIYLCCATIPLAARFLAMSTVEGILLAACVGIFTAYMVAANRRHYRSLFDAIVLRFEHEAMAAQLAAENLRREAREIELREARQQADDANRAKGEFLAIISHEIRTPMNGVLGMLRIVRDTALNNEQRNYIRTASDSAEKLLLLLNDVLDFTKMEAGHLELQSAAFPPAEVARDVVELMHTRARDKGLQLELHLPDNLPGAVLGDPARLRQALGNLIGNAIKFTERGRIDFTVTCARRTDTGTELHFTVADTGIGIESAALERLFKPFSQADSTLGRRYGGAGLGLAISARLAEAMGGALQVQSTVDHGTTFRLILPCVLPAGANKAPEAPPATPLLPRITGRVLVVEDDLVNQQVIDLFLKRLSLNTRLVADGETAVRVAATETFDVVLMDCQLPGMDGLEATRQIRRRLAGGRPIRIIALTANVGDSFRERCREAGMDDYLAKPVRLELLAETLERNLRQN
jgi:signal transduction histidine kinase